jgi:DeoR/GlpR family transcriptional regulator of sugar metabolism
MPETEDRKGSLLAFIAQKGFVSLHEMADFAQVSESTVRRTLATLEDEGLIRRTRGGAVFTSDTMPQALAFTKRQATHVPEKQAIALAAAGLVEEGETLIFSGGTTTYELANQLVGRNLQIVTNSVPIASLFSNRLDAELVMIGGHMYPRTGITVGPLALAALDHIHANKVFVGAAGVVAEGLFDINMSMVEVERKMFGCADQVIGLVDHSKFGRRALTFLAELDELDLVITDGGLEQEHRQMLEDKGVRLIIAEQAGLAVETEVQR